MDQPDISQGGGGSGKPFIADNKEARGERGGTEGDRGGNGKGAKKDQGGEGGSSADEHGIALSGRGVKRTGNWRAVRGRLYVGESGAEEIEGSAER